MLEGEETVGRRMSLGRADAAGLRARRLLGGASAGARLAVLQASCRSAEHGFELVAPRGAAGAPARRRHGRHAGALRASDRSRARRRRARLPAAVRPARARGRPALRASCSGRFARRATRCAGALRAERAPLGTRAGPLALRGRARAGAVRRAARALDLVAADAGQRRLRARARHERPRGRLAGAARRLAARSPTRWWPTCARSAAGSRPGGRVESLDELRRRRAVLLDVTPRQLLCASPARGCPTATGAALTRYRYGPGVFKLDWALDGPIPWRAPEVARAGTVHLGGTLEEIAASRGGGRRAASTRSGRSCCWRSRACSTRPAPRRASTPPGPTATCRTARRAT